MSFKLTNEHGNDADLSKHRLTLLYELTPSSATNVVQSYGIQCAQRAGLPANILDRAYDIYDTVLSLRPIEKPRAPSAMSIERAQKSDAVLQAFASLLETNDDGQEMIDDDTAIDGFLVNCRLRCFCHSILICVELVENNLLTILGTLCSK